MTIGEVWLGRSREAELPLCAVASVQRLSCLSESLSCSRLVFISFLKQNLLCVIGCVSVDLCDWFLASCRGGKRACPFFFFLFLPLPTPLHPSLSGSWRGGRRGGQGRVSKGSQVSGWWLRWDTWHAPERLDQWGALLGGSGYVA